MLEVPVAWAAGAVEGMVGSRVEGTVADAVERAEEGGWRKV